MIHELKCEKEFFEAILSREKSFEVRKNDRMYAVGDYLALNEVEKSDDGEVKYTNRSVLCFVTCLLDDERFCKEGFVIMGITVSTVHPGGSGSPCCDIL